MRLPADLRDQAETIVAAFFRLRGQPEWQASARASAAAAGLPAVTDPGNTSVLMSYDFHVDASGHLRLIEINTNASLSLIVDELHRHQNVANPFSADFKGEILDAFAREFADSKSGSSARELRHIGIVDHKPFEQRLFVEFAMYQELFKTRGWSASFFDPSDLTFSDGFLKSTSRSEDTTHSDAGVDTAALDLVYNRDTDFYFTGERTRALREALLARAVTITPHPHEYLLLADKDRLLELSKPETLANLPLSTVDRATIERSLIKTIEVSGVEPETLWKDRKKWFFKPRRSHGGKAVYRGSSTSRGTFQSILEGDYLAQEIVPPPTVLFDGETEVLKYDLRFYVYRDKIQLACARLYRGQMTNSQSPGGGVAPIEWV